MTRFRSISTNHAYFSNARPDAVATVEQIRSAFSASNLLFDQAADLIPLGTRYISPDVTQIVDGQRTTKFQVVYEMPPSLYEEVIDGDDIIEVPMPWVTFSIVFSYDYTTAALGLADLQMFVSAEQIFSLTSVLHAPIFLNVLETGRINGDPAAATALQDRLAPLAYSSSLKQLVNEVTAFALDQIRLVDKSYLAVFDGVETPDARLVRAIGIDYTHLPPHTLATIVSSTADVPDSRLFYNDLFDLLDDCLDSVKGHP